MDILQTPRLKQTIWKEIQKHTKVVAFYGQGLSTKILDDPIFEPGGAQLCVGRDVVTFELRLGHYGHHSLRVKTAHTDCKVFKETKAGYFVVENVVAHVMECLKLEAQKRNESAKKRRLIRTAESIISRMEHLTPEAVFLSPSTQEGKVDLQVVGLSEEIVWKLLRLIQSEQSLKDEEGKGLWDHLQDNDFEQEV